jgi:hypothetical protein
MNAELKSIYSELEQKTLKHDLVQDNKTYFTQGDKCYFVRMPSPKEIHLAETTKHKLFIHLIQDSTQVTKSKLKAILKESQHIDFGKLEAEKQKLQEEIQDLYMSLAIKKDGDKNIDALKSKLQDLKEAQFDITLSVSNYLSASIEDRVEKEYIEYLTYLCTYTTEKDENKQVWDSFDSFLNDNSILPEKAVMYLTYLLFNLRSN